MLSVTQSRQFHRACFSERKSHPKWPFSKAGHKNPSSMGKHNEDVADERHISALHVRECGGARILGSSASNGTYETRPKNTMKGADGESNIDSPSDAKAYLVNGSDCIEKRFLRGGSPIGVRVDINLRNKKSQSQDNNFASSLGGNEKPVTAPRR